MNVRFSTGANRDVKNILEYIAAEAGSDIAADFHSELQAVVERIKQWPNSFQVIHDELRRAIVGRFPYQVIYDVRPEGQIRLFAIRHHRQRPDFGLDR